MNEKDVEREQRLAAYDGPDRVVSVKEYLELKAFEKSRSVSMMSGFSQFDKQLEGLQTGEVTVVSGHTRNGKTLFAESWLKRLMEVGFGGCYFSFEVLASRTAEKFLMRGSVDNGPPLYFPMDLKAMNVDWLLDRIEEAKIKYDCRIFVIDHLHFIVDMLTQQNMSLNIGATMRRLKMDAANRLNVAVILIAHQGQGDQSKRESDASLENIRDSSFIGQEADNVLIVSRRRDFQMSEIQDLPDEMRAKIQLRMPDLPDLGDPYKHGFANVQIAKARRSGAFRWSKLFQKCGSFLEEV